MIKIKDKEFIIAFGKHLRKMREDRNLTQEALAFRFEPETSANQIGRIERGEINTTLSTIKVISKALEVTPMELFDF